MTARGRTEKRRSVELKTGSLVWISEDSLALFIEVTADGYARFRPLTHPEYWSMDEDNYACFTASIFIWDLVWEPGSFTLGLPR